MSSGRDKAEATTYEEEKATGEKCSGRRRKESSRSSNKGSFTVSSACLT